MMAFKWLTSQNRGRGSRLPKRKLELELLEDRLVPAGVHYPEFSLPDLNPNSPTSGHSVSPAMYRGEVSGYYFANAG